VLRQIGREELWERLRGGEQLVLVDALSPISFAASHLPGAVNVPPGRVDELAPQLIGNAATPVVVYCSSESCDSSVEVAERLVELGYGDVLHYAGGKSDWTRAGLPLEGGRA
jgi:rhodanese-related sulfurtransferase